MDRSGYARGTLAPRAGMQADVPALDAVQVLTMMDMGMAHDMSGMAGMHHGGGAGEGGMVEVRHPYPAEHSPANTLPPQVVSTSLGDPRSEEHTSELQSLMRISYAVFCLKNKKTKQQQ